LSPPCLRHRSSNQDCQRSQGCSAPDADRGGPLTRAERDSLLHEMSIRRDDVVEVFYSARYDYPALIRGDASVRQVDDWFWIKADRLTPVRP